MSESPTAWQAPEPVGGPAPGIEFASPGSRLVAYIVDILVITAVCFTFAIVGFVVGLFLPVLWILAALGVIAVSLGYFPWYWSHGGQTPGMKLMRIKVVRDQDGGPVTAGPAILRLIGFWISSAVFYIGFIWIFFDARRRGWPDLIGGTIVITSEHF
jgi:uncharacterized RDD family membrane protein YckC